MGVSRLWGDSNNAPVRRFGLEHFALSVERVSKTGIRFGKAWPTFQYAPVNLFCLRKTPRVSIVECFLQRAVELRQLLGAQ